MKIESEEPGSIILSEGELSKKAFSFFFLAVAVIIFMLSLYQQKNIPVLQVAVFIFLCAASFVFIPKRRVIVNKRKERISIIDKSAGFKKERNYSFRDIKAIMLELEMKTNMGKGIDRNISHTYWLEIVMDCGNVRLCSKSSRIIRNRTNVPEREMGRKIALIMGVPFLDARAPTFHETLLKTS